MDIAAARPANHHRGGSTPAVMGLGRHIHNLVEGATDEVHELKFSNRTHAGKCRAKCGTHDSGFGDGRIDDSLGAEAVDESIRDFECPTVNADVLADTEH